MSLLEALQFGRVCGLKGTIYFAVLVLACAFSLGIFGNIPWFWVYSVQFLSYISSDSLPNPPNYIWLPAAVAAEAISRIKRECGRFRWADQMLLPN